MRSLTRCSQTFTVHKGTSPVNGIPACVSALKRPLHLHLGVIKRTFSSWKGTTVESLPQGTCGPQGPAVSQPSPCQWGDTPEACEMVARADKRAQITSLNQC